MGKRGLGGRKSSRFPGKKWPIAILLGALAAIVVSRGRSVISAAPKKSKAAVQELTTDVKTMFGKDAAPEQPKPMEPAAEPAASQAITEREEAASTDASASEPESAASDTGTTAPTPPETIDAGVDETGTFRPTRAETDDYGVVVTDDEPAGLEATEGWVQGDGTSNCPEDYPIKGNANSRIYHKPGEPSYEQTIPEICFADEDVASQLGYRPRKS
jgi:hypothetical protein